MNAIGHLIGGARKPRPFVAWRSPLSHVPAPVRRLAPLAAYVVLSAVVLFAAVKTPTPSLASSAALLAFIGIGSWMFLSENYPATLGVLLLYLGLMDGFLKLKTGM